MRIYLSGPITGVENYVTIFEAAAKAVSEEFPAATIVSPAAEKDTTPKRTWLQWMRHDLKLMLDCDRIVMLPQWERSKGAIVEYDLACSLGIEVHFLPASKIVEAHRAPTEDPEVVDLLGALESSIRKARADRAGDPR